MFGYEKRKVVGPLSRIKLLSMTIHRERGYLFINGFFVNKGDHDMENVLAVAECFTSNGKLIVKSDMLVDDMTVRPKQVSSFSIPVEDRAVDRAYIDHVKVSFKYLLGQEIEVVAMND